MLLKPFVPGVKLNGKLGAGENIAEIGDEPSAHKALMASPEHRDNILESHYRKIGIAAISVGDYTTLYVQEFSD